VLEAARRRFAGHGYEAATIRAIAADAGVDPALVHHFYGSKEQLFVAAMHLRAVPSQLIARMVRDGPDRLGERIARSVLELWDAPQGQESGVVALLRSAMTNDAATRMLKEFVTSTVLGLIVDVLEVPDAAYRASLVASQLVGLGVVKYVVRIEPLASTPLEDLVVAIGPTLQRYLTEDVRVGAATAGD
jgi:AcrR family transcriptional regulator